VLGSSNLTGPALTKNVELNVLLTGTLQEPAVRELDSFFLSLWDTPGVVSLTKEVVNAYRVDQSARERLWRQVRHSPEFRRARELVQRTLPQRLIVFGPQGTKSGGIKPMGSRRFHRRPELETSRKLLPAWPFPHR